MTLNDVFTRRHRWEQETGSRAVRCFISPAFCHQMERQAARHPAGLFPEPAGPMRVMGLEFYVDPLMGSEDLRFEPAIPSPQEGAQ